MAGDLAAALANDGPEWEFIMSMCEHLMYAPAFSSCLSVFSFIYPFWQRLPLIIAGVGIVALIVAYMFRAKLETGLVNILAGSIRWKRRVKSRIVEKAEE